MSRIMPLSMQISQRLAANHHYILRLRIIGSITSAGNANSIQAVGSGTTVAVPMSVPLLNSNRSPELPMGTAKSSESNYTDTGIRVPLLAFAFVLPVSLADLTFSTLAGANPAPRFRASMRPEKSMALRFFQPFLW